ncbi:MAG: GatB/YqeY domain-containing protein [Candidatus Stygibacter australis]|nr:GatB/YqeY domain-containing protein [Candidatus Stygibacter australis]
MIEERLNNEIKDAMRSRDKNRLKVLRTLKSALKQVQIDTRKELTEDDVIGILKGEQKKRRQAMELFITGGRQELVDNEQFEIDIIDEYLPRPLSEEELTAAVAKAVEVLSPEGIKDMGMVMKHLKEELGNRADGKQLSILVRQTLNRK